MIQYKNIFERLSAAGYSSYRLKKEKLIGGATIDKIRNGECITTETIDTLCRLCQCQPGDILEYRDAEE